MTHDTASPNSDTTDKAFPLDAHILGRMDKLADIVAGLDDDTITAKLPIPAINTLAVLLRHVQGSARYWLERVCLGRDYVRDRDAEFSASGTVCEELQIYREQRSIIAECLAQLRTIDRTMAPAAPPTDKSRWWCSSIEGVVVHVFHEAAQHLGHAEITRDALLAGLSNNTESRASRAPSLLDAVVAQLQDAGHAADFIEGDTITTVDGLNVKVSEVIRAGVAAELRD